MSSSGEEAEFDDESDEDMPLAGLKKSKDEEETNGKRRRSASRNVSYAEDDDDEEEEEEEEFEEEEDGEEDDDEEEEDDDDDDVPLAALKATSPKKKASNGKKKSPATKKKKTTPSKKEPTSKNNGSDNYQSPSAALYGSECQKGLLIQRLLCRWWYAMTWPDPATIPEKPPKHYDSLDGIPGVFVCTSGDDVGTIKDFRDKEKCPNFLNFAKKSTDELQTLLIKALEEQKRVLIEAEGAGTPTEKELDNILKWARKVRPASADKEAVKVLKAAKMSLP